ncbi:MAG: AAA family ATPase [Chloroflexota bacterium]
MTLKFQESNWPNNYRKEEIEHIVSVLLLQRSLQVVGLSGMGKSTLLRFFFSHPELLTNHPDFGFDDIFAIYIDCNSLRPATPHNFFREMNHQLPNPMKDRDSLQDGFLLYRHIQSELAEIPSDHFVYIVIDQVSNLEIGEREGFFGQLRSLRDQQRFSEMSFILGDQRPIDALYHLSALFGDTCWIKPLGDVAGEMVIEHHAERLRLSLPQNHLQRLQRVSGGHPGLLKNCMEMVKLSGDPIFEDDQAALIQALLNYRPILSHSQRLWDGLTETEQMYLIDLDTPLRAPTVPTPLVESGLVFDKTPDTPEIFSALWRDFLQNHIKPREPNRPMRVQANPISHEVDLYWRGRSETVILQRKLVFNLFNILADDLGEVVTKDDLIRKLYPNEDPEHITDDAVFQLIAALRGEVDIPIKRLCPNLTESFIQNVRGIGYRLLVDLPMS